MTAWLSNRVWLIAATLATVIGSYLAVMVNRYGQIGGDGPNFWGAVGLLTQLPGVVVGERLFGVESYMVGVLGAVCGVLECFVVFWIGLLALTRMLGENGEPGVAPTGGQSAPSASSGTTIGKLSVRQVSALARISWHDYRCRMPTVNEIEKLALGLPETDRAVLASTLLDSLSPILDDEDEGIAEALRRDAELEADPSLGLRLEQLDQRMAQRRQ